MREFISFLAPQIQAYTSFRKASGRTGEANWNRSLFVFDGYVKEHYPLARELSQEMVDAWCNQRETESNNSCRARIYPVVDLIRYLSRRKATNVAEPVLPRHERCTYIPHAFTKAELMNFFRACDEIPHYPWSAQCSIYRITVPVFFRLLYSSGIRTCEARMLRVCDVNLSHGVLNISLSKGIAQHYVALHDSTLELLRAYDAEMQKYQPGRVCFFPAHDGSFRKRNWVSRTFQKMWGKYNSKHSTAYELRHNYAVENINSWTDEGFGFDAKLLYLSKSMGHSDVECTKKYYSLVPRMADILLAQSGDETMIPEVSYEESL